MPQPPRRRAPDLRSLLAAPSARDRRTSAVIAPSGPPTMPALAPRGRGMLGATDVLMLAYNVVALTAVVLRADRIAHWPWFVVLHLAICAGVVATARAARSTRSTVRTWIHVWFPVLAVVALYEEAGVLRHLVRQADLDHEIVALELALLGQPYYVSIARRLDPWSLELWHGIYFSYFPLLLLPGAVALARGLRRVREYVFVYTLTFAVEFVIAVLVPVSGPAHLRAGLVPPGVAFIPIMDTIHAVGTRGGLAFPSLHVAASLVAAVYAGRWFPRARWAYLGWSAMIALSTVVCTYHYVLDVVAGAALGLFALAAGARLWRRLATGREIGSAG